MQELYKKDSCIKIFTASNFVLGGGIETGSLTEVFREFRTEKTQIRCIDGFLPILNKYKSIKRANLSKLQIYNTIGLGRQSQVLFPLEQSDQKV